MMADFISVILNNGGEVSTIKRTLKTNYSPCGPVKMEERNNSKALGKDGNKARTLQDKWEQQMQLAITKAQLNLILNLNLFKPYIYGLTR